MEDTGKAHRQVKTHKDERGVPEHCDQSTHPHSTLIAASETEAQSMEVYNMPEEGDGDGGTGS